jgi:hypothetical protein
MPSLRSSSMVSICASTKSPEVSNDTMQVLIGICYRAQQIGLVGAIADFQLTRRHAGLLRKVQIDPPLPLESRTGGPTTSSNAAPLDANRSAGGRISPTYGSAPGAQLRFDRGLRPIRSAAGRHCCIRQRGWCLPEARLLAWRTAPILEVSCRDRGAARSLPARRIGPSSVAMVTCAIIPILSSWKSPRTPALRVK